MTILYTPRHGGENKDTGAVLMNDKEETTRKKGKGKYRKVAKPRPVKGRNLATYLFIIFQNS